MGTSRRPNRSHYKRISEGARNATLGSHVPRRAPQIVTKADLARIPAPHRTMGRTGEISQVLPSTSTRETDKDYRGRVNRGEYAQRVALETHRRSMAFMTILIILALLLTIAVGGFAYVVSINGKMEIKDPDFRAVMAQPVEEKESEETAVWALLAASFDETAGVDKKAKSDEETHPGADMMFLVRLDKATNSARALVIPGTTYVLTKEGGEQRLGNVLATEGEAAFVRAVTGLTGIQPTYYAHISQEGLVEAIDKLGGMKLTLENDIVDPSVGTMKLTAGTHLLSGEQVLFLCRAAEKVPHKADDISAQGLNVALAAQVLIHQVGSQGTFKQLSLIDTMSDSLRTNVGVPEIFSLLKDMNTVAPLSETEIGFMPGSTQVINGVSYYVAQNDGLTAMVDLISAGKNPSVDKKAIADSVDKKSFSIIVNNGSGIDGAAAAAESVLTNAGFEVESIGNAPMAVYDETLVVYKDSDYAEEAEALAYTLGIGRAVFNNVHYTFDSNVYVVVGKDWETREVSPEEAAE